jgi:hypothetical protein
LETNNLSLVVAASPVLGCCIPFGVGGSATFGPYVFFRYANLPSFSLVSGDILAFDLSAANEYTPAFASIAMATPTQDTAGTYTTIVGDSAASGKGDTIVGNFDLRFTITAPYSFPGGSLIIRFQHGGSAAASTGFTSDTTNSYNLVYGRNTDTSG